MFFYISGWANSPVAMVIIYNNGYSGNRNLFSLNLVHLVLFVVVCGVDLRNLFL